MSNKPDLEQDLRKSKWIRDKANTSTVYSQNLYAALCNNRFFYNNEEWTCSWRYAGGLVSELNNGNDYMDYYCSGVSAGQISGYINEGEVTEEIRLDLMRLGWLIKPYENIQKENSKSY